MVETQKLRSVKLWFDDPTPVRGGYGNVLLGHMGDGGLKGEIKIDVTRRNATKVLGRDIDLTSSQVVAVNKLPEEISNELIVLFHKIEKLLR